MKNVIILVLSVLGFAPFPLAHSHGPQAEVTIQENSKGMIQSTITIDLEACRSNLKYHPDDSRRVICQVGNGLVPYELEAISATRIFESCRSEGPFKSQIARNEPDLVNGPEQNAEITLTGLYDGFSIAIDFPNGDASLEAARACLRERRIRDRFDENSLIHIARRKWDYRFAEKFDVRTQHSVVDLRKCAKNLKTYDGSRYALFCRIGGKGPEPHGQDVISAVKIFGTCYPEEGRHVEVQVWPQKHGFKLEMDFFGYYFDEGLAKKCLEQGILQRRLHGQNLIHIMRGI